MQGKIKSIEIALENELQERDFYLAHSRRTKNAVGKAMFEHIARDEDEHYLRLKDTHERLIQAGTWPERISIRIHDINIMDVLLKAADTARSSAPADSDDRDALKTAIEFETKGYGFYQNLSTNAASESERNFFEHLASMEREHLNSLKETLLYFEDPANWFALHEKPGLDG